MKLLIEALEALPVKELIVGQLFDPRYRGHYEDRPRPCFCAIGALAHYIVPDFNLGCCSANTAGEKAGLTVNETRTISGENDNFQGTPAERWTHMRKWAQNFV